MDHIDKVLATASDNPLQFSLPIRTALVIGKNNINRYYNKTDYSETYRIAMSKCSSLLYILFLMSVTAQSFTRDTSSLTSRHKIGNSLGSTQRTHLSVRSTIARMLQQVLTPTTTTLSCVPIL